MCCYADKAIIGVWGLVYTAFGVIIRRLDVIENSHSFMYNSTLLEKWASGVRRERGPFKATNLKQIAYIHLE